MEVNVAFEGDSVIYAEAPKTVELEVTYTEPGVKGDTSSAFKTRHGKGRQPLKPKVTVNIPLFINIGEKMKWIHAPANTWSV
ncbi:MAG: hypothetical protein R2850_10835 [Bacteroidia bacterium]